MGMNERLQKHQAMQQRRRLVLLARKPLQEALSGRNKPVRTARACEANHDWCETNPEFERLAGSIESGCFIPSTCGTHRDRGNGRIFFYGPSPCRQSQLSS
jgi:hypothetical protein